MLIPCTGAIFGLRSRSGLDRKLRATIDVPVIPSLTLSSVNEIPNKYRVIQQSRAIRGKGLSVFKTGQQLDVTFQYPDIGLVQGRLSLCKALVSSPTGPITINKIGLSIIRKLHMNKIFGLTTKELLTEKYKLGSIRPDKVVDGPTDLSSLISDFRLKQIISPSFSGKCVHTVYFLELVINCTSREGAVETVSICGHTNVLAPSKSSNPDYLLPRYQKQPPVSPFDDTKSPVSDKELNTPPPYVG